MISKRGRGFASAPFKEGVKDLNNSRDRKIIIVLLSIAYLGVKDSKAFFGQTSGLSANNLVIDNSGKVGIGTATPATKLEISQSVGSSAVTFLTLTRTDGTVGGGGMIDAIGVKFGGVNDAGSTNSFQVRDNSDNVKLYVGDIYARDREIIQQD